MTAAALRVLVNSISRPGLLCFTAALRATEHGLGDVRVQGTASAKLSAARPLSVPAGRRRRCVGMAWELRGENYKL
jgi:hypothetical protein